VLALSRAVFGDALVAMRLWPALAVAAGALAASALAARLGGGRFARTLAAACVLSSPTAIVMGSFFSMNAFELLLWAVCALVFVELIDRGGVLWLGFGALLGLAVMNKHTSATFASVLILGSLLTPARHHFRTRWPWLGMLLAALIVAPNVVWQMAHGWPSLEFYGEAQRIKNVPTPAMKVLAQQLLVAGPVAAPIAILGLVALLRGRFRRATLPLGLGFVLLLAALILSHSSRADRLLAYYPIVFAAGATVLERVAQGRWGWLRITSLGLVTVSAAALLPLTLPIFSPSRVAAYAAATGVVPQFERNRHGSLPQWLADRLSWPDFVVDIAQAYGAMSAEDQSHTLLFSPSYGEAGALELWGPRYSLPVVLSNHNSYYLWSESYLRATERQAAGPTSQTILLSVGVSRQVLERWFERVELVGTFHCDHCIDWRRERAINVARLPRQSLLQLWPELKHYE
jgi:hypothetical protein